MDTDFPAGPRITKQMNILWPAHAHLLEKIQPAIDELEAKWAEAAQTVEDAKRLPEPANLAEQVVRCFRASEIRQHLEKAGVNATQLILDAANAGRVEVLQTVTESAFPCVADDIMQGAYEMFLKKFHPDLLRARANAEAYREALTLKLFSLQRGIEQLARSNFS